MKSPQVIDVINYFMDLQDRICLSLENIDGQQQFTRENIDNPGGGLSRPRALADGPVIEKAAVQFSHSLGDSLPPAATDRNPHFAGKGFQATAISMIVHPLNPYAPTTHMNLRFFLVNTEPASWFFGGGFDLTPYYPFLDDVKNWHLVAKEACDPFGSDIYTELKNTCDEYFYLPHRKETRGVGGIFFDDWNRGGFENSFAFVRSVGEAFLNAYNPILIARKDIPWGKRERDFQLIRRGRYAEFNLAIDRGTKYGLQSGRRIESVLASLPPLASWQYNYQPEPGSAEAVLYEEYLKPKDWLSM
ncbi:MAG: oxygen-dependent coproporphyrinogen oxidase [Pseudomonadales bacterium]|nr:oxygen-dependent coproporphyrinogen oxidase [Pseudomonadales bacterium]